jgi:hypothetical protein
MALLLVPACRLPTVSTAVSVGGHFASRDGLQPDHDYRRQHHRVDRRLPHRPVRAAAVDGDPHSVRRGQNGRG